MKLYTQVFLAVLVFTGWALYQQAKAKPVFQASIQTSGLESSSPRFPRKSKNQVTDVTRDTISLIAQEDSARTPSSHQPSTARFEREYLLKKVGLTQEQYERIQKQREKVDQDLQQAEAWAQTFGVDPDEARKPILEKHVMWMQSSIGIGHYQRLQEAISSRMNN